MAVDGPIEALTSVVGGLAGLVIGFGVAQDAIQMANQLDEIKDVVSYAVLNHPYATYAVSISGVGTASSSVCRVAGHLADRIFGTYEPNKFGYK